MSWFVMYLIKGFIAALIFAPLTIFAIKYFAEMLEIDLSNDEELFEVCAPAAVGIALAMLFVWMLAIPAWILVFIILFALKSTRKEKK